MDSGRRTEIVGKSKGLEGIKMNWGLLPGGFAGPRGRRERGEAKGGLFDALLRRDRSARVSSNNASLEDRIERGPEDRVCIPRQDVKLLQIKESETVHYRGAKWLLFTDRQLVRRFLFRLRKLKSAHFFKKEKEKYYNNALLQVKVNYPT